MLTAKYSLCEEKSKVEGNIGGNGAFTEGGVVLCAIEKAYREGKTHFAKPVSCHLYPIRVKKFGNGTCGLNYHRWDICSPACRNGEAIGVRVYESLKEPLIRRFGTEFYEALDAAAKYIETNDN